MDKLIDFYSKEASSNHSTNPYLAKIQQDGLKTFQRLGFPSRHDEDWKYTAAAFDPFLKQEFVSAPRCSPKTLGGVPCLNRHEGYLELSILNGEPQDFADFKALLPDGVIVESLLTMIEKNPEQVSPYLNKIRAHEDGFQSLNTAFLQQGLVLYLSPGVILKSPIVFKHAQNKPNQAVYLRHLIIAEEGASATLIEDYSGVNETVYLTNTITEVALAARAQLIHYKTQRESKKAFHMGHIAVRESEGSLFQSHSLSLGGQVVRSDLTINLKEKESSCLLNGIYIPNQHQHMDHHTRINHLTVSCESDQDYKGVLKGDGRAVFNGQVYVAPGAQHTKANQQNKNILLSPTAEIDTKPQLEIFADDVVCAHGATVGQLDEEAKFYLSSRGMDEATVMQYLIQAFIANNAALIGDAGMKEWMLKLIYEEIL